MGESVCEPMADQAYRERLVGALSHQQNFSHSTRSKFNRDLTIRKCMRQETLIVLLMHFQC